MTTPTPAETLRAAAALLDAPLTHLGDHQGPWTLTPGQQYPQLVRDRDGDHVVASTYSGPDAFPAEGLYIALMHPGVGRALVAWLRAVAEEAEAHAAAHPSHRQDEITAGHPIAVAHAILGRTAP